MNFYVILLFWICPRAWVALQTCLWDLPLRPGAPHSVLTPTCRYDLSHSQLQLIYKLTDFFLCSQPWECWVVHPISLDPGNWDTHLICPTRFVLVETELNVIHLRNFMEPENHQPTQGYASFLSGMFGFMFLLWFCDIEGDPHPVIFA